MLEIRPLNQSLTNLLILISHQSVRKIFKLMQQVNYSFHKKGNRIRLRIITNTMSIQSTNASWPQPAW